MRTFEGNVYSRIYAAADESVADFMHQVARINRMSESEFQEDAASAEIRELMFYTDMFPTMRNEGTSVAIHELARRYGLSVDVVKTLSRVRD